VVALEEEFHYRGYGLYTLTKAIGFWPAAIEYRNKSAPRSQLADIRRASLLPPRYPRDNAFLETNRQFELPGTLAVQRFSMLKGPRPLRRDAELARFCDLRASSRTVTARLSTLPHRFAGVFSAL
jgi:hypothetical protein